MKRSAQPCDGIKGTGTFSKVARTSAVSSQRDVLISWLQTHGASLEGLILQDGLDGQGLGCYAGKDFNVGDLLFLVPKQCMFGIGNVLTSGLAEFVLSQAEALGLADVCTADALVWITMLAAKSSPESPFHHYMISLDPVSPSLLRWPAELLGALDGTNLSASLHCLSRTLQAVHEMLCAIIAKDSRAAAAHGLRESMCDVTELQWACGHYLSRRYPGSFLPAPASISTHPALQKRVDNLGNLGTLVPLLDILNHSDEQNWLRFEVREAGLAVICDYPRKQGEELLSNYGAIGNEQLLFAFGFAVPYWRHEELSVKLKGYPTCAIGPDGVPSGRLWEYLAEMVHRDRAEEEGEEEEDAMPRTVPGDDKYHHPDEVDCLMSYIEVKLMGLQQHYDRAVEVLGRYGVTYSAKFPALGEEEEEEGGQGAGERDEEYVQRTGQRGQGEAGWATMTLTTDTEAKPDPRAVGAALYLASQHSILCETHAYLREALEHALQYQPSDDEEGEEGEQVEDQGEDEEDRD